MIASPRVAVVVPAYRVAARVLGVLARVGHEVDRIYVIDDCCPEGSGALVREHCRDARVTVIFNDTNQGVGGAVLAGYRAAVADGMGIVVKVDGDGQMDPALIPTFVRPLQQGWADYAKGNRFFDLAGVRSMPSVRLLGNAALSLISKVSTGYWNVFDPTNGYTAIDARVLQRLPLDKINKRYFFETDMLFRLNTLRCVVVDVPMEAVYDGEHSSLRVGRALVEFAWKHASNILKRIFYNYFLRDMSIASIELLAGIGLVLFGTGFGLASWDASAERGVATPLGTIMISVLPILIGVQLILAFLSYDMGSVPSRPIGPLLEGPGTGHGDGSGSALSDRAPAP